MKLDATRLSILTALAVLALGASGARAQEADEAPAEYEAIVQQAVDEYLEGRWAEAGALFRRAHAIFPNARTHRGIGMASYELREYPDAVRNLRLALSDERRALPDELRQQTEELLGRAIAFVGIYTLDALPAEATLIVDGHAAEPEPDGTLLLSIGRHDVRVRAAPHAWEASFSVRGGENEPLPVVLDVPAVEAPRATPVAPVVAPPIVERPPPEPPVGGYALIGAGAGLVAIGVALLVAGLVDYGTVEGAPFGTSWETLDDAYARGPILAGVGSALSGLGVAAAITGGVWLAIGSGPRGEAAMGVRVGGAL